MQEEKITRKELEEIVVESDSVASNCGELSMIKTEREGKFTTLYLKGLHTINAGETIRALYEESAGLKWIKEYSIMGPEKKVKRSCTIYKEHD